jgi:iron complex transport system substrate-binding protein
MPTEAELERITYAIRGCGMRVHQRLGPGCLESAYSPCFAHELRKAKLEFHTEVPLTIVYEGIVVPHAYVVDYTIENCVIGELKAIESLASVHYRQMDTYLAISGYPVGLILNFGQETFFDGVVRRVNNSPFGTAPYNSDPATNKRGRRQARPAAGRP